MNCFTNLPAPPFFVQGQSTLNAVASQLAAALVDTNTFTINGAAYTSTTTKSAGLATFRQYGTWSWNAGKPPGHMVAPYFPSGAVMLSTAEVVCSSPLTSAPNTPSASTLEIPGSVRSAKLVLNVTARIDGYLKMRWVWQDEAAKITSIEDGYPISGQSTFRILVNGARVHWSIAPVQPATDNGAAKGLNA
jgi:hypothetical protein